MDNLTPKSDPALLEVQDYSLGRAIPADGDIYRDGAVQSIAELMMLLQSGLCPHCVRKREQRMRRSDCRTEGSRSHDNPPDT